MPYFLADGSGSGLHDFAGRLKHSIKEIFISGYDRVIVIPADQPNLNQTHLSFLLANTEDEVAWLSNNRGGIAAFSISNTGFDKFAFNSYNWNSRSLSAQFERSFNRKSNGATILDINNWQDLVFYLSKFKSSSFTHTLTKLLASCRLYCNSVFGISKSFIGASFGLRGPPMC